LSAAPSPGRVLWPLGLAICLSLFGDLTLFAVLVSQLDAVGLTLSAAGVMLGIHRLIRIPGNPLAGLLYDRWGRRPLFVTGMVLALVSTAGYGLVRGFWPFLATRLVWGLAWMLLNVGGLAMVVDVSGPANRGRWMGVYNTWIVAGFAVGPVTGGFLVDALGFQTGFLVLAAITAVGLAVAMLGLPETAPQRERSPQGAPAAGAQRWWGWDWLRTRLRAHRGLVQAALLYLILLFTGEGIIFSTLTLLLQRRFGGEVPLDGRMLGVAAAGGLLLGFRSAVSGLSGPLAGHLSDRRAGRLRVIAGGLAAGAAGFGVMAYGPSLGWIVLGVALSAAGSGAVVSALAALVGDLAPAGRPGAVMGLYAAVGDVGSTAGPFLVFPLAEVLDLRWIYLICTAAFVIGLGVVWSMRRGGAGSARQEESCA